MTYIEATLASVDTQIDSDWVHYLVDGGSTDGTIEILRRAANRDARRRVITGADYGLYDAVLKGFERAAQDAECDDQTICVWVNADDLLMPWGLATLRREFDSTGADWMTGLPSMWDDRGRLVVVQPYNWYPRWLIRAGQFHGRSLGFIQQESTCFTYGLLRHLSSTELNHIRRTRLAGDFLLWRAMSKHSSLISIPTCVAGFRSHGRNASTTQMQKYFDEIDEAGVWIPPTWLGRLFRVAYRVVALSRTASSYRRRHEIHANSMA